MKITNSMTGKKEEFVPLKEGEVKMYACGITVYDLSHIGHARQAIDYAMITEYFRYRGYHVTYVRNYTDVDDKIIKRANELGKNALEFSGEQILETEKDMVALHVKNADIMTKASEYIPQIIKFVEGLIEKDHAYVTKNGDVYFSVKTDSEYGKLSHRKVEELRNGVRIELDEQKEDPVDFAIWKAAKPGEIFWESPWGRGRPGWHIECSAMALDTLGKTIDIHGGGKDLVFPHHENEIAQSESLTGKTFANYWSHCGLIKINGQKMGKSLGNSLTIRDALAKYNYEVIKHTILSKHYTSDIDLHDSDFQLSEGHMYYFYSTIKSIEDFISNNRGDATSVVLEDEVPKTIISKFIEVMDDDFNSALAIANLHTIFKYANNLIKSANKSNKQIVANTLAKALEDLKSVYRILGFFEQKPEEFLSKMREKYLSKLNINVNDVETQLTKRAEAKKIKDFKTADAIRDELEKKGILVKDTREGTVWDLKMLYNFS